MMHSTSDSLVDNPPPMPEDIGINNSSGTEQVSESSMPELDLVALLSVFGMDFTWEMILVSLSSFI